MNRTEWLMLIVLSILWGSTFFFAEIALTAMTPFALVMFRVALAATALLVVVHASGHRMPATPGPWIAFFVMGGLNNLLPFSLIFWGQTHIAGGLAAILNATTPLFTVVLAHLLTRDEKITPLRLAGVGLGIAGVAVMIGPAALTGLGDHVLGQVAVLAAACCYALAGIFGRRFRGLPSVVVAAGQATAATVMMVPAVLAAEGMGALTIPVGGVLAAVIALALLSTALAYILYFRILATAGATNLLLVTFLIPVSAILLGTVFLAERLTVMQIAGMALIALGLAAIDGRLFRLFHGVSAAE
jgi:drug/metabolite transporter (DMT)-like permease